jgi:MYXO-CTERM domain-containing protein
LVCFSDYDCLQGEVCVVPDAFARPEPDMCYCANDACTECGMPAMEGSCQIQQAWCGDELCEPGFECQSIIAPCLPGAECAPASQQCVPTTSECLSDAECLEGWSCQQPEGDGSRCAALVAPTEGDQAMPAERCAGPAISVCVPDGGGATCDGAVCNVFTGEEGTPNSDRNDGCTVSVASTPSPASALLLLFGIGLAAIRRR